MGKVYAYEHHNGWDDCMFLTDHLLSDRERYCSFCEEWSKFNKVITSVEELIHILEEHGIVEDDEPVGEEPGAYFRSFIEKYELFSSPMYTRPVTPKDEVRVGLFFFINGNFTFAGCRLTEAEMYGDYLVYPKGHLEVWDKFESLKYVGKTEVDYDYYPRGRVIYKKSEDLFIIYYDKCVESQMDRITRDYEGYKYIVERDEHYCCYNCSENKSEVNRIRRRTNHEAFPVTKWRR